jgi:hypothetical protein
MKQTPLTNSPHGNVGRWGDYPAAVIEGDPVWLATEYIANSPRTALASPGTFSGELGASIAGHLLQVPPPAAKEITAAISQGRLAAYAISMYI